MNNGLTFRKVKELAYELAVENNISVPTMWKEHKISGIEWLRVYEAK